jgi:hypothetical protein
MLVIVTLVDVALLLEQKSIGHKCASAMATPRPLAQRISTVSRRNDAKRHLNSACDWASALLHTCRNWECAVSMVGHYCAENMLCRERQ